MRIALYARKSTEQEDRQVQSLDDQIRELTKLANREGLTVVETFHESKSAKAPNNRPEFDRLMSEIEAGRFEGILTWSINRLSRNPVDGGRVAYMLQMGKLSLIRTIDRSYKPQDNALLMSIENGMATAYLQDLSKNVSRGLRGKVERGWATSKAPIGYKNNAETREIECDPKRFKLVREAWSMLLTGNYSVCAIHREMEARGLTVPSRRGTVRLISRTGLFQVFKNPFYSGQIRLKGQLFPGKHIPMISPEEFRRAQAFIERRTQVKKPIEHSFAFTGAFTCLHCGCAGIGEKRTKTYPRTGRTVEYIYYHCSGSKGCPKVAVRQEVFVSAFHKYAKDIQILRSFGEWLKGALFDALERDCIEDTKATTEPLALAAHEQERLDKLILMRADGELSAQEFSNIRTSILGRISDFQDAASRVRDRTGRILRRGRDLVQAAIDAGELSGGPVDPMALGAFARACGRHFLDLSEPEINIDPVLQKIATFEPLRNGSETPKIGDYVPLNSIWWTLIDDILNLLRVEHMQQVEASAQSNQESG